jgi:NAD(P)-dependent dehydrogenase (short-subunit alcohol dehydrogenase family)
MRRLEGKTALVTGGGTKGVGRATATRLVEEGAHVFIVGRRVEELNDAAAVIGPEVSAIQADITNLDDLDRVYDAVRSRGKGLDILVANAASATMGGTLAEMTGEVFDQIFNVNVKGTLFTVQKALPLLNEQASIILTGSTADARSMAGAGAYAASKAAVRSFARTWAAELTERNVRVNIVSPGPTDTSGLTDVAGIDHVDALKENLRNAVPMKRLGKPEEVAAAIAFFASSDSSFILGAELYVDGGTVQL